MHLILRSNEESTVYVKLRKKRSVRLFTFEPNKHDINKSCRDTRVTLLTTVAIFR